MNPTAEDEAGPRDPPSKRVRSLCEDDVVEEDSEDTMDTE